MVALSSNTSSTSIDSRSPVGATWPSSGRRGRAARSAGAWGAGPPTQGRSAHRRGCRAPRPGPRLLRSKPDPSRRHTPRTRARGSPPRRWPPVVPQRDDIRRQPGSAYPTRRMRRGGSSEPRLLQPLGEHDSWQGPADEEALRRVAPELSQAAPGLLRLDALGYDAEAEVVAEIDRRAHDHVVVLVVLHVHDERPVDLQDVDREPLQLAEGREAGAEVVDRERHAEVAQPLEDDSRPLGVGEDRVLRDLDLEQRRIDAVLREQRLDLARKVGVEEVARGEVDRNAGSEPLSRPAGAVRAALRPARSG